MTEIRAISRRTIPRTRGKPKPQGQGKTCRAESFNIPPPPLIQSFGRMNRRLTCGEGRAGPKDSYPSNDGVNSMPRAPAHPCSMPPESREG